MNLNQIIQQKYSTKKTKLSTSNDNNILEVYFKDIEKEIIKKIRKSDLIFGCIAWLTNENIL